MAEQMKNQDLGEQTRVRREKLAELQAAGEDPFQLTRFDWDATSRQIRENFDAPRASPSRWRAAS